MSGSNLPPGVTESMIPGNRPEDGAEEAFWDQLAERLLKARVPGGPGMTADQIDGLFDDPLVECAIIAAREMGYSLGLTEGRMEEQLAREEEVRRGG